MRLLIVGAGGHGEVVADILHAQRAAGGAVDLIGYVDDDGRLRDCERFGRAGDWFRARHPEPDLRRGDRRGR